MSGSAVGNAMVSLVYCALLFLAIFNYPRLVVLLIAVFLLLKAIKLARK